MRTIWPKLLISNWLQSHCQLECTWRSIIPLPLILTLTVSLDCNSKLRFIFIRWYWIRGSLAHEYQDTLYILARYDSYWVTLLCNWGLNAAAVVECFLERSFRPGFLQNGWVHDDSIMSSPLLRERGPTIPHHWWTDKAIWWRFHTIAVRSCIIWDLFRILDLSRFGTDSTDFTKSIDFLAIVLIW